MGMMTWMRRVAPFLLGAVLVAFIVSLAYFGSSGRSSGQGAQATVVTVNGEAVSAVTYQQAYRLAVEQYRQTFRERWTEEMARSLQLQEQVLQRLIAQRLVVQRAAAEGITVSDAELADHITRIGAFQESGRFSRTRYLQLLARQQPPLSPAEFEEDLRVTLLGQKVQMLVEDGAQVTPAEVRARWEVEQSRVRAAALLVPATPVPESVAITDADLASYHQGHTAEFTEPERRRLLVAVLSAQSVPVPSITEAEVEAAYQARRSQFEQPPRVRVAHILVRVPETGGSAAEDQARSRAEAALARVRGGADFATVARETSEDGSTAGRGGDLGLVGRGELVAALDQVVFTLKAGDLAGPIRSPLGYHVVRVQEVQAGSRRELREVAPTLRATLQAEGQLRALRERAQEAQSGLISAADFAAEARRRGLAVREVGPLRRGEAVEGVATVPELTEAIFALPPDGVSAPVKVPEGYAIVRLLESTPSRQRPLAEAREDVLRAVRRVMGEAAARQRAQQLTESLRRGEDPKTAARAAGATYSELGPFSVRQPLGDRALAQTLGSLALALPDGGVGGPVPGPGGVYVVKLLGRERPDAATFEAARRDVETRLLRDKRSHLWQAWIEAARASAKIEINREVLPER